MKAKKKFTDIFAEYEGYTSIGGIDLAFMMTSKK